ncbi:GAP family protein [Streptomyces sp. So13.3]|uniref:GAP family protein n=1 Tax=Streptomyces TaxID=1883 RepID=UPI0011058678|nr:MULTISPECIES: GAP family protein [Streptomyces]MCZ4099880.1 GAP family protein [Streptomyces sp. H39-C1]QNA73283.1 GAP family protein [Streptomyces sp. So13.3]
MGDAIGQMLVPAVGIAVSPIPLIAIVLMLATPRGRVNGTAFAAAWMVTLAVVSVIVVLAGSGADARVSSDPASWTSWVKLALGILLLLLAGMQWRGRPQDGQEAQLPRWMESIEAFSPAKSALLAAALVGVSPKNLILAVGGALSIASSSAGSGGKTVAIGLFVLIGSLCALVPLGVFLLGGDRAVTILQSWKTWMAAHNAAITAVLLIVLGTKFAGDAISALT